MVGAGLGGLADARRNLFSGLIDSAYASSIIETGWRGLFGVLTDEQMAKSCFVVRDRQIGRAHV